MCECVCLKIDPEHKLKTISEYESIIVLEGWCSNEKPETQIYLIFYVVEHVNHGLTQTKVIQ